MRNCKIFTLALLLLSLNLFSQSVNVSINPGQVNSPLNENFTPGTFFVPKTPDGFTDFMNNGIQQSAIRTNVIESALNNATNLAQCLSLLTSVQSDLQAMSAKTQRLIFIFEKMPPWLSSSSDASPAQTPGWAVLHTKPPASWAAWQTAVDSITSVIVNQMGISNAWFEVWNEPDIGSWTGTQDEYWMLYKTTYDGVKNVSVSAKVGGPAVNGWANNIGWQPFYGFVDDSVGDSTLIGQLLDSSVVWNRVPDFISWHNFSMNYLENYNAENYISQKLASLALGAIPLIVSEWNAPSAVRDTRLASAYSARLPMRLSMIHVTCNVFAAWQDFSPSTNEFHNDYGLLSYGAIHKPVYYSTLLAEKLQGSSCGFSSSVYEDIKCSVGVDTVYCLISNYCPPPFFEAFNHSLFYGQANIDAYDSAEYIDASNLDFSHLDSIYRGLIAFVPTDTMGYGIAQGILLYQHFDSIDDGPRTFQIQINGYSGNYIYESYIVDSMKNNMQFKYDSLTMAGYTQNSAIAYILPSQGLISSTDTLIGGTGQVTLMPNAVCLLKIAVPGVSSVLDIEMVSQMSITPNPAKENVSLTWNTHSNSPEEVVICDANGRVVYDAFTRSADMIDVSAWKSGVYFARRKNNPGCAVRFVKL